MNPYEAKQQVFDIIGSKRAVARLCGVSDQAVGQWDKIPSKHCAVLEMATEGKISCRMMRPDFPWPRRT